MIDTVMGARVWVSTEMPDRPCYVRADRSQFETALVNMAVNARDAMDGEGQLTLQLTCGVPLPPVRGHGGAKGPFVRIATADTGTGIPPEALGRIFEPFFTTKEVGRGPGLGLSQVFGFAKQFGGDVDVRSQVGQGTTFSLYLPETHSEALPEEDGRAPSNRPMDGGGLHVLIVEDNTAVGRSATDALADLGFGTTWAVDAHQAMEHLTRDPDAFHVVFSDVVMPGMAAWRWHRRSGTSAPICRSS